MTTNQQYSEEPMEEKYPINHISIEKRFMTGMSHKEQLNKYFASFKDKSIETEYNESNNERENEPNNERETEYNESDNETKYNESDNESDNEIDNESDNETEYNESKDEDINSLWDMGEVIDGLWETEDDDKVVTFLTHNGRFHTDEVTACAFVKLIEEPESILKITRSRDMTNKKYYNWVVDVGKEYNNEKKYYDHHQQTCDKTWPNTDVLLSSCGMVFLHNWDQILTKLGFSNSTFEEATQIYKRYIAWIDANDNGQSIDDINHSYRYIYESKSKKFGHNTNLIHVVSNMNGSDHNDDEAQMINFEQAVSYMRISLFPLIESFMEKMRQSHKNVQYIKQNCNVNDGIIEVPRHCYIGKYVLNKVDPNKKLAFTIYQRSNTEWGFSAIQDERFINRIDLVEEDKIKYPNLVFIHKKKFCGSSTSKQEAYKICEDSIKQYNAKRRDKVILYSLMIIFLSLVIMLFLLTENNFDDNLLKFLPN